jgi:hypothetical protein
MIREKYTSKGVGRREFKAWEEQNKDQSIMSIHAKYE